MHMKSGVEWEEIGGEGGSGVGEEQRGRGMRGVVSGED